MDKQIYHAVLQPDGRTYIIQEDIQFVLNQIRFIHFDNINTAPKPVIKYGWIRANTPGLYSKELVDWIRRDLDAYIIPGNSLLAIGLVDSDTAKLQMLFFDIFNKAKITALETSVTANTQDITTLNTDVTTNTQNITTLGTDVATNTQAITALETDVANNKYTHPSTHPATIITQDTTHRFVTDAEKTLWNRGVSPYHLATISSSGPTSLTTADLNAYSLILVELQLKPTSTFSDNISVHTVSKIVTPEQFSYSQREDTKGICYINDVPNLDIHMAPQCTTQGGEWRQTPITYTAFGGVALYFENSSTVNVSDTVILSKAYLKVSSQNGELTVYMPTSGNSNYTIQMHIYGIE